jgi:hypothetical protein
MSRSGYTDDCENLWLYRQAVERAIKGKRGQAFLREMLEALDAMPEKRLIADALIDHGEVCAIGSVGVKRGVNMEQLDIEAPEQIAEVFGIAPSLVQEIEFENDEAGHYAQTPEDRWQRVRAWVVRQLPALQHSGEQK